MLDSSLLGAPLLDHQRLDLRAAERVKYVLEQSFRYEYEAPVRRLCQRLVIVPPARHGSQRRLAHRLEIAGARASRRVRQDAHGNVVAWLEAEQVPQVIEFKLAALVERVRGDEPTILPDAGMPWPRVRSAATR